MTLVRLAPQWQVLVSEADDGATNMATDVALMEHAARTGEATLRIYRWSRPTLSLGRHERARGLFDAARLDAARVAVVRRPTGGRALLHDREVTYSVTAPAAALSLRESFGAINRFLLDALRRLGVTAAEATTRAPRPLRPEGAPCFAAPSPGELVVDGAKLVGSAQLREDGALMQHGSILLADDQSRIAGLKSGANDRANLRANDIALAPVATLGGVLGRDARPDEVIAALLDAFADACRGEGVTSRSMVASDSGIAGRIAHHRARFEDPEWTWRR